MRQKYVWETKLFLVIFLIMDIFLHLFLWCDEKKNLKKYISFLFLTSNGIHFFFV